MEIENNQSIEISDFSIIEKHYFCPVSDQIRNFIKKYNGTIVTPQDGIEISYVTDTGLSIKDGFPTILHTKDIINRLQFIDYIEDFLDESQWNKDDVEWEKLLPLMSVNGGSVNLYVAIAGIHENKLFVVDNGDYGVSKVKLTFSELLTQLEDL